MSLQVRSSIKLEAASKEMTASAEEALPLILDYILDRSNADAPKDTYALVDSGGIRYERAKGIVYYDSIYAPYQHEGRRKDGSHRIVNRPAGGKSKFLEDVVNSGEIIDGAMNIWVAVATRRLGGIS